jgi:hypothetical protein
MLPSVIDLSKEEHFDDEEEEKDEHQSLSFQPGNISG